MTAINWGPVSGVKIVHRYAGLVWQRGPGGVEKPGAKNKSLWQKASPPQNISTLLLTADVNNAFSDCGQKQLLEREAQVAMILPQLPGVLEFRARKFGGQNGISGSGLKAIEFIDRGYVPVRSAGLHWDVDKVCQAIIALSETVQALHDMGLVHGRVCLDNLLVDSQGVLVLASSGTVTPTGSVGAGNDEMTAALPNEDVFDLATLTHELLSHFSGSGFAGGIPIKITGVLQKATLSDALQRTPTVSAFAEQLHQACADLPLENRSVNKAAAVTVVRDQFVEQRNVRLLNSPRHPPRRLPRSRPHHPPRHPPHQTTGRHLALSPPGNWFSTSKVKQWCRGAIPVSALAIFAFVMGAFTWGSNNFSVGSGTVDESYSEAVSELDSDLSLPNAVTDLVVEQKGNRLYWTWSAENISTTNSGQTLSFHFESTIKDANTDQPTKGQSQIGSTIDNHVDLLAVPGLNCLQVTAVGQQGRQSAATSTCILVTAD